MSIHIPKNHKHVWIGILLVVLGIVFLADAFHIYNCGHFFANWWPLFIIILGLVKLNSRDRGGAWFLIILGLLFLLTSHDVISWHFIGRLWPLILIVVGIALLLRRDSTTAKSTSNEAKISEDKLDIRSIFTGLDKVVLSEQFRGGEAVAIFGNIQLDLRQAKFYTERCNLQLTAVFGSIELHVDPAVKVILKSSAILGSVRNRTRSENPTNTLEINATSVFGEITLFN